MNAAALKAIREIAETMTVPAETKTEVEMELTPGGYEMIGPEGRRSWVVRTKRDSKEWRLNPTTRLWQRSR